MSKRIFYLGTAGKQDTALIDTCLDYFNETEQPVSIGTVDELPKPKAGVRYYKRLGIAPVVEVAKHNSFFLVGGWGDVLNSFKVAGRKELR